MKSLLTIIAAITLSSCSTNTPTNNTTQSAPPFSIKGYSTGQPMETCPSDTLQQERKGAFKICTLGPSTYAGEAVKNTTLVLSSGQIISVSITLNDRGQHANSEIRKALIERYGQPTSSKEHINEYIWNKNSITLVLDGWKGDLTLLDIDSYKAAAKKNAVANQSDM